MSKADAVKLNVKTIDHVTIVVKDLEKSRAFYEDILGMQPVTRPGFGFPGLWFEAGLRQIHLVLESSEAGPAGLPAFRGTHPSRGLHFAFEVQSCDQAAELLNALNVPIVDGPKSRPDGARQLYVHDPDGHLVEITSIDREPS